MSVRVAQWCLLVGLVVYPALLFAFMSENPGAVPPPRMLSSTDRAVPRRTQPPTDTRGSRIVLAEDGRGQRASIFWTVPQPGRVHVTIELAPPAAEEPPATAPDSASAASAPAQ